MSRTDPATGLRYVFARELFNGADLPPQPNQLIGIEQGRIATVEPSSEVDANALGATISDIVTPGLIDLQINGAYDTQFNFEPSVAALARIAEGVQKGGTAHFMPTFITAPGQDYKLALQAAADAIEAGVPGILGLHLEGPFLSPKYPGIHDATAIRRMTQDDLEILCASFPGKLMLTVAPEELPEGYLRNLTDAGVYVFAGHTSADAEIIARAEEDGLRGATHLFNAMTQITAREPGVAGAVLASNDFYAGIIPDGHHVSRENLKIAAKSMPDRLCLVTDAMLTLAGAVTQFELGEHRIQLKNGRLTNREGRLAGAHIAMHECVARMCELTGISLGSAVQMATRNPARALGLDPVLGTIEVGKRASMTLLESDMTPAATIIDGEIVTIAEA